MGLTTRKQQGELVPQEHPHYYHVDLKNHPNGLKQLHCGSLRDAERSVELNPGSTYHKIYLPGPPDTVDVPYITIEDQRLPIQQILPESQAEPLDLK